MTQPIGEPQTQQPLHRGLTGGEDAVPGHQVPFCIMPQALF